MKCPKDADKRHYLCCDGISPDRGNEYRFECTRLSGHKGKHHAHDLNIKCLDIWE